MAEGVGARFAAARAAWLLAAREQLARDDRVVAALVIGSIGRGTADDWSDVDLVVVIDPGRTRELLAARETFVRSFGNSVFELDSPWNAAPDSAQVNALYDVGGDWPLYVDWDLWPAGRAAISPDVEVMFDRAGLPATPLLLDEYRSWPRSPRPAITPGHLVDARLAMLPIIAKCLVRGDTERAERMLANLGYDTASTPADLLETTRLMWEEIRPGAGAPLARTLDRVLLVTAEILTGDS